MFPATAPTDPIHLSPAAWGEAMVVAPATADFIGKLTHGLADDIPSATAMTFTGKLLIAPAMNPKMWTSLAVRENVTTLFRRGVKIVGPEEGAMGGVHEAAGVGRMSEPETILDALEEMLIDDRMLSGLRVLVTSGPTREAIDPVRYLTNHSSGKMGDAIARRAHLLGAEVFLVRGKGATAKPPAGVDLIPVDSAAEMSEAVKAVFPHIDMLFMTAAVSDWTPVKPSAKKIKKDLGVPRLELTPTEDILGWAGANRENQFVAGFALETENHLEAAEKKLISKGANLIVLNDATEPDSAFGGDTIKMTLLFADGGREELQVMTKARAADLLLETAFNSRSGGISPLSTKSNDR
jgi:phosphopantothenoylcysteine decarboxylase/phosphopantothenate--cysteine ligase